MKLCSRVTLFAFADETETVFRQVLDRFFDGMQDPQTIRLLKWER